ncbi:MAG: hypothetical protein GWP06_16890 [Actinobacteria bacterium]|nr:hypothetical protein [Actinomycetota bacterium]
MNSKGNSIKLIIFATLALFVIGIIPSYYLGGASIAKAVLSGYIFSLFNIIFSYVSISWSFSKNSKIFFKTIYAGMALRFSGFILVLFIIYKFTKISLIAFIISFMIFYIFLQYYEIKLVNKQMQNQKTANNAL